MDATPPVYYYVLWIESNQRGFIDSKRLVGGDVESATQGSVVTFAHDDGGHHKAQILFANVVPVHQHQGPQWTSFSPPHGSYPSSQPQIHLQAGCSTPAQPLLHSQIRPTFTQPYPIYQPKQQGLDHETLVHLHPDHPVMIYRSQLREACDKNSPACCFKTLLTMYFSDSELEVSNMTGGGNENRQALNKTIIMAIREYTELQFNSQIPKNTISKWINDKCSRLRYKRRHEMTKPQPEKTAIKTEY